MPGLPSNLYTPCRDTLCRCREFHSYRDLRAVFVTEHLFPFRIGLPQADNIEGLVDLLLDHLIKKHLSSGQPVLPIFLATLRDRYEPGDSLRDDLHDLHTAIQAAMAPPESKSAPTPRSKQFLFDRLLQLDFRPQVRLVKQVIEEHRVAAFLIHGPPAHGQWVLTHRLAGLKPEWKTGQHVTVDARSNGTGKSSQALWWQLARKLQLPGWTQPDELVEKVGKWWQSQDIIFTFNTVDFLPFDLLSAWIEEFWVPLAIMARRTQHQTQRRTNLLLFLIDNGGGVCDSGLALARHPQDLVAHVPLLLPAIEQFPELELDIWIDAAAEVLPSGLSAATLVNAPYNGVPELVYEKVCEHCGFSWEGEIAR